MKLLPCLILFVVVNAIPAEKYACPEFDVDFYGYDVNYIEGTVDWHHCGEICLATNDCHYWTYHDSVGNINGCFLKSSDDGLVKSTGKISGARGCQ